jgi:hypothetical protein
MDLAEQLETLVSKTPTCKVGAIIKSLDDRTSSVLARVLQSNASNRVLAETLTSYGLPVGRSSIGLHRTGRCNCGGSNELG